MDHTATAFWNRSLTQSLKEQGVSEETGLSDAEARSRLRRFGANDATDYRPIPLWRQFLQHFCNPLVIMLLVASLLSTLTGDTASFVLIVAMVLLSVTADFLQEMRAQNGINTLRRSVAVTASVLRDGRLCSLPVQQVVPGDIVHLSAGDLIPADGRLIAAKDLFVNQALLTGESFPAEKNVDDLATPTNEIAEAANAAFMGSSVISGTATLLALQTGRRTYFGQLAGSLSKQSPPTSFETGIAQFGLLIMRVAIVMLLCVLLINLLFHRPLLQSFVFALALAVGLTPELLPMIMTVTLARGALDLAKRRAIVKHLPAMHNLGAMDVLCTDKTGTLTQAKINLIRHLDAAWQDSERVFELAWLNSHFESGLQGALDEAILAHGKPAICGWTKIDEVPFDFIRRRVAVLLEKEGSRLLVVKGAPEEVIKRCDRFERPDKSFAAMDAARRAECIAKFEAFGEQGLRVLAIAFHPAESTQTVATIADETSLIFAGFALFLDPPKPDAATALQSLNAVGVQVKVLTGDNERVTRHVWALLGRDTADVLTGNQISDMTEDALRVRVKQANLFCRVNPQQKQRIIQALQASGSVVCWYAFKIDQQCALNFDQG